MTRSLGDVMEFDHVIQVHADGSVTDGPTGIYGPDSVWVEVDQDSQIVNPTAPIEGAHDWEFLRGYTGQYGYNGPIMHPSEFIGGGLARDILETPGLYVCVVVECLYPEDVPEQDRSDEPAGWAIAYRESS